jgi:hypothetical protein
MLVLQPATATAARAANAVQQFDVLLATLCRLLERQRQVLRLIFGDRPGGGCAALPARCRQPPLGQALRVEQQFVCGLHTHELAHRSCRGVAIRVPLHDQPTIRALDFVKRCVTAYAKDGERVLADTHQ